ncbi:VSIG4 protein, partial [Ceuthmochares aereus]|nr:VSIG4 protein [Ceuthmochares aereus]
AFLDLSGLTEIEGVWKASTTVPCAYVPLQDFEQQTVTWLVEHDKSSATIFRRDESGDHILLSTYRDRVSVLKDTPGNVSLQILNLEMSDRGTYTCQVSWRMSNNSLITREITTKLEVIKVPATKPTVRAGEQGLSVPAGSSASLTCEASGSPPIRYRWFRDTPGEAPRLLHSQPELAWGSLQPDDAGTYFCEAKGR